MGVMLATLGQLTQFRVTFSGIWGSVTLIYRDKKKRRMRRKKPCMPGAVKGKPKLTVQLPAAVLSVSSPPAHLGVLSTVEVGPKLVAVTS